MGTENQKQQGAFIRNDLKSFEMLFNQYYQPLTVYGYTLVKDRDEAEDIVQQVFISVWEKKEAIEIHTSFRAFLYRAVHNACMNRIKQQAVRSRHAKEVQFQVPNISVTDVLQQKELRRKIDHAIEQLPIECGRIFRMSRYDNMKYQEIADQLQLSVKTVENQMGKALKLMREHLKEYLVLLLFFIIQQQ